MKYSKIVSMGLLVLLAGAFVIGVSGGNAQAAISGTPHDLSGRGWGSNQICIFCHTPHNASTTLAAPLWNHGVTVATYTIYASSSLNATVGQPGPVSKACLSCHDGTVAIDTYGTRTGTNTMTGSAMVGTDLSNDHPVGFTYDAALATADNGLATPTSAAYVDAAHTVPLYTAKLECGSCHNVHDNALGSFLRKSNASSGLCLTCHTK
jgi:predicted CXXCH cytochrome family protein